MKAERTIDHRVHDLDTLEEKVAQTRDELFLKLHLARADARDQFDRLEEKWSQFRRRLGEARRAAGAAGDDLLEGLRGMGHDIAEGYERIRRAL